MKTLENKKISCVIKQVDSSAMKVMDVSLDTTYFKLIFDACNRPSNPQAGFVYEDIKSIDRVKNALKDDLETADLEDADFEFVKNKVTTNHWNSSSIEIADMIDYIKEIQ